MASSSRTNSDSRSSSVGELSQTSESTREHRHQGTVSGLLARVYWILVAHAALSVFTLKIATSNGWGFSMFDLAFGANLVGLVVVRYLDITRLGGRTSHNEPATLVHWRRYSAYAVLVWGLVWFAAHGLAGLRS